MDNKKNTKGKHLGPGLFIAGTVLVFGGVNTYALTGVGLGAVLQCAGFCVGYYKLYNQNQRQQHTPSYQNNSNYNNQTREPTPAEIIAQIKRENELKKGLEGKTEPSIDKE